MRLIHCKKESWPLARPFRISRGSKSTAQIVLTKIEDDGVEGRGECVPYERYEESCDSVISQIKSISDQFGEGELDRTRLQNAMPPGAARNALDCALWDLAAKKCGLRAHQLADSNLEPKPVTTAFTLSVMDIRSLEKEASRNSKRPLLKLKMAGEIEEDLRRVDIVRRHAPRSKIIVDANEAWSPDSLPEVCDRLADLGVCLIEQPLPAGSDQCLEEFEHPVPICADESAHDANDLPEISRLYDAVNIKLDKTGGLTGALEMLRRARSLGLGVMVGCMVCTSLSVAPALLVAQQADFVDLDGPLLLSADREPGVRYEGSLVHPASPSVWG